MRNALQWKRLLAAVLGGLLCLALLALLAGYAAVRLSLPKLDGEKVLAGLSAPVTVERDALGVVTLRADNRLDLARGTGFVHGQDRFFAMDLQRRAGTGEIAALLGGFALDFDKQLRLHGGPALVRAAFERLPPEKVRLLEAYAEGVNAGLASLGARPPEYLALRLRPEPWRAKDTLAVGLGMYYVLQDAFAFQQQQREALRAHFPHEVVDFLLDAPGFREAPVEAGAEVSLPFPAAEWAAALEAYQHRSGASAPPTTACKGFSFNAEGDFSPGSNAWAVGPGRTLSGRALLAGDPHLRIGLPVIWYRVSMHYRDETGEASQLHGVTIPGAPFLVAGSNTRVAWSPTNSYARLTDLVRLELHPDDPSRYHDGTDYRPFGIREETMRVRGRTEALVHRVKTTAWGPVWTEPAGRKVAAGEPPPPAYALRWMGSEPYALAAGLRRMERAASIDEVFEAAPFAGIPTQNIIAVDDADNIGWTILGALPRRDAVRVNRFALSPAEAAAVWDEALPPGNYPRVQNPASEALWSANHEKLRGGAAARLLGDGGYARDGRADRIRERLLESREHDEQTMLSLQLDASAAFFADYREFLLARIDDHTPIDTETESLLAKTRDALAEWDGTAAADSIGFRLLYSWYNRFRRTTGPHLFAPVAAAAPAAATHIRLPGTHAAFREIILNRPEALLPAGEDSWDALHLRILRDTAARLTDHRGDWSNAAWGDYNRVRAVHPFSMIIPFLSRWIDMPDDPMSGSVYSPRVHRQSFGQSYRMAVSPGREDEALFTMPGGNSGHPLSPFYDAGHAEWFRGEPLPLLPGETRHKLRLLPMQEQQGQ